MMSKTQTKDLSEIISLDIDEKAEILGMIIHQKFMTKIQLELDKIPMKKKELAKAINVSQSYYSQLMQGDKMINMKTLGKISHALDVRFDVDIIHEPKDFGSIFLQFKSDNIGDETNTFEEAREFDLDQPKISA